METLECIKMLEKKIIDYMNLKGDMIAESEKHICDILVKLLDYFFNVIKNIKYFSYEESDEIIKIKNEILEYLKKQGYLKEEFRILDIEVFDDSAKYLYILNKNLFFYFADYKPDINLKNIYYYLFHLIYYILLIIVNSYSKNLFEDKNIKFYLYHIIHFFSKDKKSSEYYFLFYEGAFKFLSKKYSIYINYLYSLDKEVLSIFKYPTEIISKSNKFYNRILNKTDKNEDELNFLGKYINIKKEIYEIIDTDYTESENLENLCEALKNKLDNILKIFSNNKVECEELKKFKEKSEELSKIISKNCLTENHFNLMFMNYKFNDFFFRNIETLLLYAKEWVKYNNELNEDNTEIFTEIITSPYFQELYLTAMKSSYIKNFTIINNLNDNYNIFMNNYAKEINKYILYVPLTKGINAYIYNFFRIALNLNGVELIGEFVDKNQKIEVYQSYLLVQLLYESFHFIYRLDKINISCLNPLSPEKLKEIQTYKDIGVDIIFYLFGTEYITYFSLENCKIINRLESWTKEGTNFKVFDKIYLFGSELKGKDNIKYNGLGLKCDILEDDSSESYICSDSAIKYCF